MLKINKECAEKLDALNAAKDRRASYLYASISSHQNSPSLLTVVV